MSYIHAGGTEKDKKKLRELHNYLKAIGIDIDYEVLKLEIEHARTKIAHKKALQKAEAELFARGKVRKFRYGSAFCPHCGMFKNYEKECPYCGYHEMTL